MLTVSQPRSAYDNCGGTPRHNTATCLDPGVEHGYAGTAFTNQQQIDACGTAPSDDRCMKFLRVPVDICQTIVQIWRIQRTLGRLNNATPT